MKNIRVAVVGVGGRGNAFYKNVLANNGEIVAACDVWEPFLEKARQNWGEHIATLQHPEVFRGAFCVPKYTEFIDTF